MSGLEEKARIERGPVMSPGCPFLPLWGLLGAGQVGDEGHCNTEQLQNQKIQCII